MAVLLASNGEQALVTGDAITNQLISFAHPDWKPGYVIRGLRALDVEV